MTVVKSAGAQRRVSVLVCLSDCPGARITGCLQDPVVRLRLFRDVLGSRHPGLDFWLTES